MSILKKARLEIKISPKKNKKRVHIFIASYYSCCRDLLYLQALYGDVHSKHEQKFPLMSFEGRFSVPSSQSQLVNPRLGTIAVKYNLNVHIFIKKVFYRTNAILL